MFLLFLESLPYSPTNQPPAPSQWNLVLKSLLEGLLLREPIRTIRFNWWDKDWALIQNSHQPLARMPLCTWFWSSKATWFFFSGVRRKKLKEEKGKSDRWAGSCEWWPVASWVRLVGTLRAPVMHFPGYVHVSVQFYANFHHLGQSTVILTVPGSLIHKDVRAGWSQVQISSMWSSANGLVQLSLSFLRFKWGNTNILVGICED